MKNRVITIILIGVLLVGLGIFFYPTLADMVNSRHQSHAIAIYDAAVEELSAAERATLLEEAQDYNERLYAVGSSTALYDPEIVEGYWDILDITGTGIMGYITIDEIDVNLPIYHGTAANVLSSGAGHLQGTSFPVSGENTHSVISAHRGLPSAKLFTNLNRLEVGDRFTVTVLGESYVYEVDKITIVLPTEVEGVYIEDGADYCTLMTCTPYGINTHRLLVRGHAIGSLGSSRVQVSADARKISVLIVMPFIAVPLLLIFFAFLFIRSKIRRHRDKNAAPIEGITLHNPPEISENSTPDDTSKTDSS